MRNKPRAAAEKALEFAAFCCNRGLQPYRVAKMSFAAEKYFFVKGMMAVQPSSSGRLQRQLERLGEAFKEAAADCGFDRVIIGTIDMRFVDHDGSHVAPPELP